MIPRAAKKTRALFIKSIAVASVSLLRAWVYAKGVAVDRGVQVGVTDPGLLRSRLASLGVFGLCGAAAVNAPTTTVRDSADYIDVDVHHLARSFRDGDLWSAIALAVAVDESATVQTQVPQDYRDGTASHDNAVSVQLELDSQGGPFPGPSHGFDLGHDPRCCGGQVVLRCAGLVLQS